MAGEVEPKDIKIYLGGIEEVERATGQPHELIPLEGQKQFLTTLLVPTEPTSNPLKLFGNHYQGIAEQAAALGATAIVNYRLFHGGADSMIDNMSMGTPVRPQTSREPQT